MNTISECSNRNDLHISAPYDIMLIGRCIAQYTRVGIFRKIYSSLEQGLKQVICEPIFETQIRIHFPFVHQ